MYSLTTTLYVIQQRNTRGVVSISPAPRTSSLREAAATLANLREAQREHPVSKRLEYRIVRLTPLGSWA